MEREKTEAERLIKQKIGKISDNNLRNLIYIMMAEAAAHGEFIIMPRNEKRGKEQLYNFIQAHIDFFKPRIESIQVIDEE